MTLRLNGSTSGYTEIDAPAVAGNNSIALPAGNGSAFQVVRNGATAGSLEFADKIVSGTAQNSTSGTAIDFTGISSWVKRVTVMFNGVSTNGTSFPQVQIGSGSFATSGYNSTATSAAGTVGTTSATSGFVMRATGATNLISGQMVLTLVSGNNWASSHMLKVSTSEVAFGAGDVSISGTLDRVRITTVNGTDTFDAGSINIIYE
jgi:hypothetical protein